MRSTAYTIFILLLIAAASIVMADGLSLYLSAAGTLGTCSEGACGYTAIFVAWPGFSAIFFCLGTYLYMRSARQA